METLTSAIVPAVDGIDLLLRFLSTPAGFLEPRFLGILLLEQVFEAEKLDIPLELEDGVDLLHRFQRDRQYVVPRLLPAGIFLDVGKLEELPSGMTPAQGAQHGARITAPTWIWWICSSISWQTAPARQADTHW